MPHPVLKTRKLKIRLQSPTKALNDFDKSWELISCDQEKPTKNDVILHFSDFSMVAKVLSAERLRLIQTVQEKKPASVNQLATLLNRLQANVHKDVYYLAELGILELKKVRIEGKRTQIVQPRFNWAGFEIDLTMEKGI